MRNSLPRGAASEILLMEIAQGLAELIKNPDLSQKIKEAYALNDAEQQELEASKKIIVNADSIRADLAIQSARYSDIEYKINHEESIQRSNLEMYISIKKQIAINEKEAEINKKKSEELENISKSLDVRAAELNEFSNSLKDMGREIEKQRQEIKEAVDKSKLILGELG